MTVYVDDQAAAASAASKSAAAASSDAAASNGPLSAQPETVAGKDVLLEGTVRVRTGLVWFKPTHVQLLAAPASDGTSCAPAWSALVVDGVAMPYEELAGVRMDESMLEFIVEHNTNHTYVRMFTRSDFNLWREALKPEVINPTLHVQTKSKPSAVHATQKWLAKEEVRL